jgi:glycosyltransferase involved in cell wall biosynthesis
MNEYHPYRAVVPPISPKADRPQWSVMIPTYNCANYLRETLESVLVQDLGPDVMQIEVVDDYSTQDDPKAVVEEIGGDRVTFHRQPQNVGHTKNFQTCLERAKGQLVHLLHGDDCVLPGFYQRIQRIFELNPEVGAVFCRHIYMDEKGQWQSVSPQEQPVSGILPNWIEQIAVRQRIQTPSMVVRREVYENLGGFDRRLSWTEDWEMWVRIAAHYPVAYEVEPLALYRQHCNSSSGRKARTGEDIKDLRKAIHIFKTYLPADRAKELSSKALDNYAEYALNTALHFTSKGDTEAALSQIKEALKCNASSKVIVAALKMGIKLSYRKIKSIPTKLNLLAPYSELPNGYKD